MYSTYVLLQADSACKHEHDLVHDVVPQKDMFLQGTHLFGSFVIFKMVCPTSVFWSVWLSSVVQRTHSTWNLYVHLHVFRVHVKFYDHVHNRILAISCMIVQIIFSIGPVFEPLALHVIDFYGSRVQIPAHAAQSFGGSRV